MSINQFTSTSPSKMNQIVGKLIRPPKTEWRPHPGPQTKFHQCPAYEVMFGGAKGPGKTECLVMEALRYAEHPEYRGIIFRRTYPRLREVVDRCHQKYPNVGGKYNGADHVWKFPSGARVALAHCQSEQDKYIYQGHEYQFEGFDQIEEFTETQYEFLKAQNRSSISELKPYCRATANPGGIGHGWVKRRFITNLKPNEIYEDENGITKCFIPASIYDNPSLLDADPQYVNRLKSLPEKLRMALLEGNWDIFEGQYFGEWDINKHVCEPFELPTEWRRYISLDYGYRRPSAVYWYAVDYDDNVYMYRELYQEGLTYAALAESIKSLCEKEEIQHLVADPAIWGDRAHHQGAIVGKSGGEELAERLPFTIFKGDNSRVPGWVRIRQYLKENNLQVFNTCENFIRTFPDLIHAEGKPEDLDSNGEDHAADSLRYFIMSRPSPTDEKAEKPRPLMEVKNEEMWKQIHEKTAKNLATANNEHFGIEQYIGDGW